MKMEQRVNIKFCFKLGKSATETYEMLRKVYGNDVLSRTSVFEWFKRFKSGRESVEDDKHTGRPKSSRSEGEVEKIREILKEDRCVSTRLIEDITGIPKSTVHRILTDDLGKKKICARFVPHSLSDDQKMGRAEHARDMISMADKDPNFLNTIVAGDETWCFQYEPLTKRQSAVWKGPDSPRPTKVRLQKSKIKTMLVTFYDSKGIIHKEFVPPGQTVTGSFYLGVMQRLVSRIRRVRPEYKHQGSWTLLHDNAPAHNATIVREYLASRGVVVLNHPPYSPDLSPCDYDLFPKLKLHLKGTRFDDVHDIQKSVTDFLQAIPKNDFQHCFKHFYDRCKRCITAGGYYFE